MKANDESNLQMMVTMENMAETAPMPIPALTKSPCTLPTVTPSKHITRTLAVLFICLLMTFGMCLVHLWNDQRALVYFYNVTDSSSWSDFNNSMRTILSQEISSLAAKGPSFHGESKDLSTAPKPLASFFPSFSSYSSFEHHKVPLLRAKFPNPLLVPQLGGTGLKGKITDPNGTITNYPILLDDVIFRSIFPFLSYQNAFPTEEKSILAIRMARLVLIFTFIFVLLFLLCIPYYASFKTTITKRLQRVYMKIKRQDLQPNDEDLEDNHPSAVTSIFLFPDRYIHGLVFVRRLLMITTFVVLIQSLMTCLTIFPNENPSCIPYYTDTWMDFMYRSLNIWIGSEQTCHSFIFSTPASVMMVLFWFVSVYGRHALLHPSKYVNLPTDENKDVSAGESSSSLYSQSENVKSSSLHGGIFALWILRLTLLSLNAFVAYCTLFARSHYLVDIGLGLIIGTLIFWLWHAMVTLYYYFQFKSHILEIVDNTIVPGQPQAGEDVFMIQEDHGDDENLMCNHEGDENTVCKYGDDDGDDDACSPSNGPSSLDPSPSLFPVIGGLLDKMDARLLANREVRDVLVPIKRTNAGLLFVGYIDGYDLYVSDNIGFCKPGSFPMPQ